MNFYAIVVAVIASIATAAQAGSDFIPHNQVQPSAQPEPTNNTQKVAVKYKPQLKIEDGCHPYPAVQKNGYVSGGLKWSGPQDGDCKGSPLGSQIYSRSTWVKDKWAVMYVWYFPKGRAPLALPLELRFLGHRHNWEYANVWLDKPTANSTILGVSLSAAMGWSKEAPPKEKYLVGDSLKVSYYYNHILGNTAVKHTQADGEFQDLITWEQLLAPAREALSNTDWDETPLNVDRIKMPMKDGVFEEKLKDAYPS